MLKINHVLFPSNKIQYVGCKCKTSVEININVSKMIQANSFFLNFQMKSPYYLVTLSLESSDFQPFLKQYVILVPLALWFCFLLRTKSVLRLKNRSRTGKTDDFSSPDVYQVSWKCLKGFQNYWANTISIVTFSKTDNSQKNVSGVSALLCTSPDDAL